MVMGTLLVAGTPLGMRWRECVCVCAWRVIGAGGGRGSSFEEEVIKDKLEYQGLLRLAK